MSGTLGARTTEKGAGAGSEAGAHRRDRPGWGPLLLRIVAAVGEGTRPVKDEGARPPDDPEGADWPLPENSTATEPPSSTVTEPLQAATLEPLRACTMLRYLDLSENDLPKSALDVVRSLEPLRSVDLHYTMDLQAAVDALRGSNVKTLYVNETNAAPPAAAGIEIRHDEEEF